VASTDFFLELAGTTATLGLITWTFRPVERHVSLPIFSHVFLSFQSKLDLHIAAVWLQMIRGTHCNAWHNKLCSFLFENLREHNIHTHACTQLGISVRRVPAYSPYAVAEMAVGLLLAVVRKIPKAYNRVRCISCSF
jgi:hypothetical protein